MWMGPEMYVPSDCEVKLACSQSEVESKEFVSEALIMGNARWATSAIEAPAPRSRMDRDATARRKAAPLRIWGGILRLPRRLVDGHLSRSRGV